MMRSMFAGVSGLRNHQIRMDVIGNNIANVNTVSFKASRANFRELFSQTLQGGLRPTEERGGRDPMQVGVGMTLASISRNQEPGNLQVTGNPTDLAIDGEGYFVLWDGDAVRYTRSGTFGFDGDGYLVERGSGFRVLGWADGDGANHTDGNLTPLRVRLGAEIGAQATSRVELVDNLDADAPVGTVVDLVVDVIDSLGRSHAVILELEKTANRTWEWRAVEPAGDVSGSGSLLFGNDGLLESATGDPSFELTIPDGAANIQAELDFSAVTQFAGHSTLRIFSQNGHAGGTLEGFFIDPSGTITGSYSNGLTRALGVIALAGFENAGGLQSQGGGLFVASNNSGRRSLGAAGSAGFGNIAAGALEMSNVDLSQEFTDMIVTLRGFQANSRVITASDEMLQELVNLRR